MKFKSIIIICLLLLITGCHNYNELDDLSICTAIAIDLEDDKYKVTYAIANSKKSNVSSKEGEAQTVLYSGSGNSIDEAINEISLISPKVLYIGHLSIVVISDDVAKKGVSNILDYLLRNQESRKKFNIVLTQDSKAEDVLTILSPLETFPSRNILSNLSSSKQIQSLSLLVDFNMFISSILEEGFSPFLSSVSVIGDIEEGSKLESLEKTTTDTHLKVNTIGLFKDNKLVTFSDKDETLGIGFLHNYVNKALITLPCQDNYLNFDIDDSKTKMDIKYDDNITIDINISTRASINEVNCDIDLKNKQILNDYQNMAREKITDVINKSIKLAQKNKTDIFGFGTRIYKKNPKKWKEIKDKWDDELFPNLNYNLKVDFEIIGTGSLKQTIEVMK